MKKMKKNKNFFVVLVCIMSLQACFNTNTTDECIKGDCYNGQGMINYENGDSFDGNFLDGQIFKGTYTFNDGTKYIGSWNNGMLNGSCEMYNNDGTMYIGDILDGQFHGIGTYTLADGSKFIGTWKNGKLNGKSEIVSNDGTSYIGEVNDGKRNGFGAQTYSNNSKWIGNWKNNEKIEGNYNYENIYNPLDINSEVSSQIIELIKGDANMHLIDVDFNGVKEKFIFDTGASNIFMTPSLLNKIKLSGAKVESLNIIDSKAEIANGDLIPIEYVRISNVKIGNFILNNLIVSVSYDDKSSLLFGKGVLNKFKNYSFSKDGSLTLVK